MQTGLTSHRPTQRMSLPFNHVTREFEASKFERDGIVERDVRSVVCD